MPPKDGPDAPAGFLAEMVVELGHKNPKIKLDTGEVVWGCECWWGPTTEEKVAAGRPVEYVSITLVRARLRVEEPPAD